MNRARTLELLAKLERGRIDRLRPVLEAARGEIARLEVARSDLERSLAPELASAVGLPGGPGGAAGFLPGARRRIAQLGGAAMMARRREAQVVAALRERFASAKRFDLLGARHAAAVAAAAAHQESKLLDELAVQRAARRPAMD